MDYYVPERAEAAQPRPPLYHPRSTRSVAARVALSALLAISFVLSLALAYYATRSNMLEALLAERAGTQSPAAAAGQAESEAASPLADKPAARPAIPNVQGLVILIRGAIAALDQANVTGNYAVLHAMGAPEFQARNSPASLSEAFASLRAQAPDLGAISAVNPRLYRDPVIDGQGYLRLAGFFPIGSANVDFELAFEMVDGRWRLFGIGAHPPKDVAAKTLQVAPDAANAIPKDARLIALIRGAVLALNQANATGDYSVLRDFAAPGFREANSLTRLTELFSSLRKRKLDLGPVAVIDPKLSRPPVIDKNGYLRLAGAFPSEPEQVNFEFAFAQSGGQWRIFGIGLEAGAN